MQDFTTRNASWNEDKAAIAHVRHIVFVEGQNVPSSIESDEFDQSSWYVPVSYTHLTLPTNREV